MASEITNQIAHAVAGPKGATIVASATAGGGLASLLDLINSGLGVVAVCAGITLTGILIRKHLFEYSVMKRLDRERRVGDGES